MFTARPAAVFAVCPDHVQCLTLMEEQGINITSPLFPWHPSAVHMGTSLQTAKDAWEPSTVHCSSSISLLILFPLFPSDNFKLAVKLAFLTATVTIPV